jgi:hypothetical protein
MDYLGVEEIPKRHIMKRWTRDARDVLPGHLEVYQNDHASSRSFTCRHSLLYRKALELVRLGDASAEAYEKLNSLFESNLLIMAPFDSMRDGLGLEDRPAEQPDEVGSERVMLDDGLILAGEPNLLQGLGAPIKNRGAGRPTTSRDRAPYEGADGLSKRTRFFTICRCSGHKRTTCPQRGDAPKQPRKVAKCTRCGLPGHRRTTCAKQVGALLSGR